MLCITDTLCCSANRRDLENVVFRPSSHRAYRNTLIITAPVLGVCIVNIHAQSTRTMSCGDFLVVDNLDVNLPQLTYILRHVWECLI